MSWTVTTILVLLASVAVLRLIAWWGWRFASRLFSRSLTALRQARERDDMAALGAKFEVAFPRTATFVRARLATERFTGLPLTLVIIAALYLAALFGGLVEELFEADELVRFDHWLNQQLAVLRTDELISLFTWITDLGGSATLVAVALVTTGLLWGHGHGYMIAPLWLTLIGSQITTYTGKYMIARPRPEFITDVVATSPSFPSGHSTSAMAVYGFMAYIIARYLSGVRLRFEVIYWAAILIGLIGFSRMLLSVHYVSDVVAGFLVGGFWLLLGFALAEHRRHTSGQF